MKLTIIYDNNAEEGLKHGWGFSCLIENEENILFDTGDNGKKLIDNLKKLDKNIKKIYAIVLSHEHWDHTGGLFDLLELNKNLTVIVPESFSSNFKNKIKEKAKLIEIRDKEEIVDNICTTGELSSSIGLKEQSLVIKTEKGNLLITGCAHPDLTKIIEKAKEFGHIYMVLGGFHGFNNFDALKGIDVISPCHCTQHIKEIKEKYQKNYKEIKAGTIFEF